MRATWIVGTALAALVAACGGSTDGRVAMEVAVSGLRTDQSFCFSWKLHQQDPATGAWVLVDSEEEPVCAEGGVDEASSVATCLGDRRFLVSYDVVFFNATGLLGFAAGTSGGGEQDVCTRNLDTPSAARFQFGNAGHAGGVNPTVLIDQVCANDKLQVEGDRLVSALWLQAHACADPPPASYCTLARGEGVATVRHGVTPDGQVRFVFNDSALGAAWELEYLAFAPALQSGALVLEHNPWTQIHALAGGVPTRGEDEGAVVAYRYEGELPSVGAVRTGARGKVSVLHDVSGSCDGPLSLDAQLQDFEPECASVVAFLGAVHAGGSAFDLGFRCGSELFFVRCDATATPPCDP